VEGGWNVPRKKQQPVQTEVARTIGGLLRGLRKTAGYRAVKDAAAVPGCPAAQQTIYAYERGGLVPSLKQFMELVEFYALQTEGAPESVRYQGVAAMVAALSSPAYHLPEAADLVNRLQPAPAAGRRRRKR
jgi:DNA-binding XRE family transcriptional regulator